MSNIQKNLIMKKEYIKPFAKVKEVDMVVMQAASETWNMKSGGADPSGASAKENVIEFLLENM